MADETRIELDHMSVLADAMSQVLDRCVWSQTMTHASLVTYLVEECYELIEAIETEDGDVLLEELGDVLLQVVFHSEIARRTPGEKFSLDDVARVATEKMVRRHPHVFGDEDAPTVDDVLRVWSAAKAQEKASRTSVLEGIPQGLPALVLAQKIVGRARRAGVALDSGDHSVVDIRGEGGDDAASSITDEATLGRRLFALVQDAQARGLDPERALRAHLREVQSEIRLAEQGNSSPG